MRDNNSGTSSGLGLSSVLTIIFVVLKLVGVIAWSWWWVLSPLWISTILWVIMVAVIFIYYAHEEKKYDATKKRKKDKWKF